MLRSVSAFALVLLMGVPAFADGMEISRPRYRHYGIYLPPERHVIEVVRPPYSANFIINGARFVGRSPACWSWAAGERIKLLAGIGTRVATTRCSTTSIGAAPARCGAAAAVGDDWPSARRGYTWRRPLKSSTS